MSTTICIKDTAAAYEPELFKNSFGFKGSKLTGVWQTVVGLSAEGEIGIGLGIQSVLWSDSRVFASFCEEDSNRLMFAVTEYAADMIKGKSFSRPEDVVKSVFPACLQYARETVGFPVTETFVLNALVPLDMAAWQLFARLRGEKDFDFVFKGTRKEARLANVPLVTYSTSLKEVARMAENDVCLFKIKLGSDPAGDGDQEKMLAWDKARASEIHSVLKTFTTPHTENGRIAYYFDANGRYETKEQLKSLYDHLEKEGIAENTVLFEEPFPPESTIHVGDIPLCFAADESIHSLFDVKRRIGEGYGALTLKPIAKTLTVTREMAQAAADAGVQCFCADLTVNPLMVEWNKNFAARLTPLRGMKIGVVESNGAQNYVRWEEMKSYVPRKGTETDASVYTLDDAFYRNAGGLYELSPHYQSLLAEKNPVFR